MTDEAENKLEFMKGAEKPPNGSFEELILTEIEILAILVTSLKNV